MNSLVRARSSRYPLLIEEKYMELKRTQEYSLQELKVSQTVTNIDKSHLHGKPSAETLNTLNRAPI